MRFLPETVLAGLGLVVLAACAHGSQSRGTSFGIEAIETESSTTAGAPDGHAARAVVSATVLPPPPVQVIGGVGGHDGVGPWRDRDDREAPAGMLIDDELSRLGYVLGSLRAARGEPAEPSPPPRAVTDAWERMLDELDGYLDQPPRATPSVQLVRIKLTVEQELESDREVWRLPGHLAARVRSRLAYLEHRVELAGKEADPIRVGRGQLALVWPVDPVIVTSDFGWRSDPFHGRSRFHYGIDLEARIGQLISAAGPGTVVWADWNGNHGKHIEISHPGGWVTRYSHFSELLVRAGDIVERGDPIGLAGRTGRATGPHLHFELWRDGDVQDPIEVLGEPPLFLSELRYRAGRGH